MYKAGQWPRQDEDSGSLVSLGGFLLGLCPAAPPGAILPYCNLSSPVNPQCGSIRNQTQEKSKLWSQKNRAWQKNNSSQNQMVCSILGHKYL